MIPPLLIWVLLIIAFLVLMRKHVSIEGPGIFAIKTRNLTSWINRVGKKHKRVFKILGDVGIFVGILAGVYGFYFLLKSFFTVVSSPSAGAGLSLVIPGVRMPGSQIYIPLVEGVIAIAIIAIVHEFAHGLVGAAEGVKPKSVALVFFLFIFGAGVEFNEREIKKRNYRSQARIFFAGSFANFLTAALILALSFGLSHAARPFVTFDGVEVMTVEAGTPADGVLVAGDTITGINGAKFSSYEQATEFMKSLKVGEAITLETSRGNLALVLAPFPGEEGRGRIGILSKAKTSVVGIGSFLFSILSLFQIIFSLSLGVGIANLLPILPFDGGRIFENFVKAYIPHNAQKLATRIVFALVGAAVLANIVLPIARAVL